MKVTIITIVLGSMVLFFGCKKEKVEPQIEIKGSVTYDGLKKNLKTAKLTLVDEYPTSIGTRYIHSLELVDDAYEGEEFTMYTALVHFNLFTSANELQPGEYVYTLSGMPQTWSYGSYRSEFKYAPFDFGKFLIEKSGNNYKITYEGKCYNDKDITVTYNGPVIKK
jgi:hypothetical protein